MRAHRVLLSTASCHTASRASPRSADSRIGIAAAQRTLSHTPASCCQQFSDGGLILAVIEDFPESQLFLVDCTHKTNR